MVGRREERSFEGLRLSPAGFAATDRSSRDRNRGLLDEVLRVLLLTEATNCLIDLRLLSVMGLVDDDDASLSVAFVSASPISSSSSSPTSDSLWA